MFTTPNSLTGRDFGITFVNEVVICEANEQFSFNDILLALAETDSNSVEVFDPPMKRVFITDLQEDGYTLLRPIPVEIEREDNGHAMATFREANVAIGGNGDQDAFQSLFAEILDTFDDLVDAEEHLGPDALRQLQLLKTYIVKA